MVVKENGIKSRDFTVPLPGETHALVNPTGGGPQSYGMLGGYGGANMYGMGMGGSMGGISYGMMGGGGVGMGGGGRDGTSACVLVNKLNAEKTTCDLLFKIFGVYGDVVSLINWIFVVGVGFDSCVFLCSSQPGSCKNPLQQKRYRPCAVQKRAISAICCYAFKRVSTFWRGKN